MNIDRAVGQVDVPLDPAQGSLDSLEISSYYKGLATFVKDCQTPMTIAVQGDWGSGKTTALNFVKHELSPARANRVGSNSRVKIVEFNTWQYSQFDLGDTLIFSMVHEVMAPLVAESEKAKKYLRAMFRIGRDVALAATRYAGNSAGVGFATDAIIDSLEDTADGGIGTNLAAQIKQLRFEFSEAIRDYCQKSGDDRVVIIIDDLDRVDPERAVEVMEALKVFFDCPQCVFILAIDFDVVARGVREKYGQDIEQDKARSFFDKIIQVPFRMPVDQFKIGTLLTEALSAIGVIPRESHRNNHESSYHQYIAAAGSSVGNNPRSMKRLVNTFELLKIIIDSQSTAKNASKFDELVIFMLLCAQTSYSEFHKEINRSFALKSDEIVEMLEAAPLWDNEDRAEQGEDVVAGAASTSGPGDSHSLKAVNTDSGNLGQGSSDGRQPRLVDLGSSERAKRFGVSETDRRAFDQFLVLFSRALSAASASGQVEGAVLREHVHIASVTGVGSSPGGNESSSEMTTNVEDRDARIRNNAGERTLELFREFENVLKSAVGGRPVCSSAQTANMVSFYAASDATKVLELGPRVRPRVLAVSYSTKGLRLQFGRAVKKGAVEGKRYGPEWSSMADELQNKLCGDSPTRGALEFRETENGAPFLIDGVVSVDDIRRVEPFLLRIYTIVEQADITPQAQRLTLS